MFWGVGFSELALFCYTTSSSKDKNEVGVERF